MRVRGRVSVCIGEGGEERESVADHTMGCWAAQGLQPHEAAHLLREGRSELPHQIKGEKEREREREKERECVVNCEGGQSTLGGVRVAAVVCERQRKRNEKFVWKMKMKNN